MLIQVVAGLCVAIFLVGSVIMIWAFVRFAIVSEWRTRGAELRLRKPNLDEVNQEWQVDIPPSLADFYRDSPVIEQPYVYIAPMGMDSPKWRIACFIPLAKVDISEWMRATGVPGVPLAVDGDKGTYYLPFKSLRGGEPVPVLFREPGLAHTDRLVAETVEQFTQFRPVEAPADD